LPKVPVQIWNFIPSRSGIWSRDTQPRILHIRGGAKRGDAVEVSEGGI
jgi:hypothetical protein